MGVSFRDDAAAIQGDLVELRKALHRHPEVGLALPHTQERVLAELDGLGLEITTGAETTSVVGVLRGGRRDDGDPRAVLIRGDMDALPVDEQTGLDFAATNGAMHACGHDLHTTALVGAARLLAGHRDGLEGDVVFMFQPGEEGFDGAGVMLREGVLEAAGRRVDAAFGMHVFSNHLPSGLFSSRPGTILSASHGLFVDRARRGRPRLGAAPRPGPDRRGGPDDRRRCRRRSPARSTSSTPWSITVGTISGGTKRNVIPDTASFEATVRRFSEANEQRLGAAIKRTLEGVAAAHGVDVEFRFETEYPTTVNTAAEVEFAADVVRDVLGPERYRELPVPISGSEDFSRVLAEVPGAFLMIGATPPGRDPATAPMNHSPRADFDPTVLSDAAAVYAGLAAQRLEATHDHPDRREPDEGPHAVRHRLRQRDGVVRLGRLHHVHAVLRLPVLPQRRPRVRRAEDADRVRGRVHRPAVRRLAVRLDRRQEGPEAVDDADGRAGRGGQPRHRAQPQLRADRRGASIILVLARLAQGLAHGGELPSAQTYIAETAPRERRGLWSSLIYFSGTIGQLAGTLLAAILSTVLTQDAMTAYGWRIPFVLGGVFGLYALYMRLRMHETEVFVDEVVLEEPKTGIWQTIKEHPKLLFQVIGLTMGATVLYYVWAISAPAYAINVVHVPAAGALWAGTAAQVVFLIVLPLWGIVSDRIGRRPVLLTAISAWRC